MRLKKAKLTEPEGQVNVNTYMIKPIVYHSFEEKKKLEAELMAKLTPREREEAAQAFMEISASFKVIVKGKARKNKPAKQ